MHTSSSPYSVKESSTSSSGVSVSTPQSSETQGISVSSSSNMETTSIVTSTINISSLQDETNNKIEDLNTLLQEVGPDSNIGEELTSLLSLLQTLSNGLGSIAGAESRNQGRRKRESGAKHYCLSHCLFHSNGITIPSDLIRDFSLDCSALQMVAATTDAIIPVLEAMKAESRNVNSFILTTKRDIAQIKWVESCLKEIQKYLFQVCTSIATRTSMLKKDSWNIRIFLKESNMTSFILYIFKGIIHCFRIQNIHSKRIFIFLNPEYSLKKYIHFFKRGCIAHP